jgi:hypothetical protein
MGVELNAAGWNADFSADIGFLTNIFPAMAGCW